MKKLIITIIAVIALSVGWYLISPLFIDQVVEEDFPTDREVITVDEMTIVIPTEEELEAMTEEEKHEKEMKMLEMGKAMGDKMIKEEAPKTEEPKQLSTGNFKDADNFHKGSGQASIFQTGEELLLRLENFSVTNGPALSVYLTKNPNPKSSSDVKQGFLNLGKLKGNKGNQNYPIPAGTDLSAYKSVTIYCVPFGVVFSTATL